MINVTGVNTDSEGTKQSQKQESDATTKISQMCQFHSDQISRS